MAIDYYTIPGFASIQVDDTYTPSLPPPWVLTNLAGYNAEVHAFAHANVSTFVDVGIGKIETFTSATVPSTHLLCDGAAFTTDAYPYLHAVLNGNNTPDLRDRFIVGAGPGHPVGTTGNEVTEIPIIPNAVPYYALVYAIRAQ